MSSITCDTNRLCGKPDQTGHNYTDNRHNDIQNVFMKPNYMYCKPPVIYKLQVVRATLFTLFNRTGKCIHITNGVHFIQ